MGREVAMNRSALALLAVVSTACGDSVLGPSHSHTTIHASDRVVTTTREVGDFSGISLSGLGHLVAEPGSSETLTITANENILPHLVSVVRGGVLHLETKDLGEIQGELHLEYHVTVRRLEELRASGVTTAEVHGIDARHFRVEISGVSSVVAEGRADRQDLFVSGVSAYEAEQLSTRVTQVLMSGASLAVVNVRERLEGSLSGASQVVYIGQPSVRVSTSGGSTLRPQD